jgi:two-component system, OmpR family, sensor histidine kinase CpxA
MGVGSFTKIEGAFPMKSLILKIFLAYWFAAGVVILISDFATRWPIHNPELASLLNTSLEMHGQILVHAYESGNCSSEFFASNGLTSRLYLSKPDGQVVCGHLQQSSIAQLVSAASASHKLMSYNHGLSRFVALPISVKGSEPYVLLLETVYNRPYQVYKHLPGSTSIAISGLVTFLLAVLVVYPIRRLRVVTREIAAGNLEARVKAGVFSRLAAKLSLRDDIDDLMSDFNVMAGQLQSLVAAHRLLLRDVSHELRSPLARLAVALELGREIAPDKLQIHLERVERESIRLNSLIGQILAFTYIESMSEPRHSSNFSLDKLMQDLLPDVQYEAESRKCRIVKTSSRHVLINGDADMLRHALENIVRNAIRHSPANGTVEISIDIDEQKSPRMAVLRVADAGPGVTEDKLGLLLNPFYRVDDSLRSTTSGFGVGLAIADRAAHLHSGKIVASNGQSGGLVIEMFLPLFA